MHRPFFLATFAAVLAAARLTAAPVTLDGEVKPLLKQFCYDCHNSTKQKGDLNLEPIGDNPKLYEHREIWEKIVEMVELGEMPPEKKPQLSPAERDLLVHFVDGQLAQFDCTTDRNPGRVTIRRLNREEYRNTIRDLLRVDFQPEDFPNDEVGYGFDNIGDVLSLPPMLMEKYLAAAEEVVSKAIVLDPAPKPAVKKLKGDQFTSPDGEAVRALSNDVLGLYREGEASTEHEFARKGEYVFRVRAYGEQAGPEPPKLALRVGGKELKTFDVPNERKPTAYEVRAVLDAGKQKVSIAYLNNFNNQQDRDAKVRGDRNLFVEAVEIEAPATAPALPASHQQLITRMPQPGEEHACAKELLGNFARRAYRRPVTDAEVERLAGFVDLALKEKGTFLEGVQTAVQAVLCSPHFLYRWELDDGLKAGEVRELNDFEVASRLSYFLWASMPDEELFGLAAKGLLRKEGNLEKQLARMLKDGRAGALVSSFASQWLQVRGIHEISPDPGLFPAFDGPLREAMKRESELFFEAVLREDRSITDLIDSDFTFLNERLARHYGIPGVSGQEFRRVALPADSPRGGVLTQGAVLLATSTPTRTAPVIRGKWILEQILGVEPPPAPPDVPPFPEQNHVNQSASLRQRFEQHRSQADCASCHAKMDPLGFALENFDAVGTWREQDGKFPIDASGNMAGGKTFNGPRELKTLLKADPRFAHNLAEKMMTYALGRGLDYFDRCAVDDIVAALKKQDHKFSALVIGIVTSEPFLKRKSGS